MDNIEAKAQAWLNTHRRKWGAKTTQRRRTAIRSFATYAGDNTVLLDYRTPSAARPVPHPIPEGSDGLLRMIEEARTPQHAALVALCGLCGLRVHEAIDTRWQDFDTTHMTLNVRGKGDKRRIVPITEKAWRHIAPAVSAAVLAGNPRIVPMADRTAREVITRLARKAGLKAHVKSHDLRATFGTAAYEKTKDLRAVQELLGHAHSSTTEVYTGVSVSAMRAAADFA